MSRRLSGLNPLAYIGVEPSTPPQLVLNNRAPTVNDIQNVNIGTLWINNEDQYIYMLVSLAAGVATWVQLYPALTSGTTTFEADTGSATAAGNIVHIAGGTNINTAGATNVLTFNLDASPTIAGPLTVSNLGLGVVQSSAGGVLSSSKGLDGQILISSTAGAPAWGTITAGSNITVTNAANSITIASTGGGSSSITVDTGDSGNATTTGGVITFSNGSNINTVSTGAHTYAANLVNSPSVSGNVTAGTGFIATTGDVTITAGNLTLPNTSSDGTQGAIRLGGNRWVSDYGSANTFIGQSSGNTTLTTGSATDNTAVGFSVLNLLTTGAANTGFGDVALTALTTGGQNSGFGANSLIGLVTGSNNVVFGYNSGSNYTGAESSNIMVSNTGTLGESNVIRIGTQGSSAGEQQDAYIAGIYSPNTALNATQKIMAVDVNGKIGGITNGTNGQLLIGSSSGSPVWGNITAGAGITVTGGANSVTITASGGASGGINKIHCGDGTTAAEYSADTSITIEGVISSPIYTTASIASNTVSIGFSNGSNGYVLIGGGGNPVWAPLASSNGSIAITNTANHIDLVAVGTGGPTYTTNAGTATSNAGTITVIGNLVGAAPVIAGQNINTTATGAGNHQVTISTNNSINLPTTTGSNSGVYQINSLRFLHGFGTNNTFVGSLAGTFALTTGSSTNNTGVGTSVLGQLNTGANNTAVGYLSAQVLTTGSNNTAYGYQSLNSGTTAVSNVAIGYNSLQGITTGGNNTCLGTGAGKNLTTSNSSNIIIGNDGVQGDNNTTRIGQTGSTSQHQTSCYIGGITPVAYVGTTLVTVNSNDQLGIVNNGATTAGQILMYNSSNNIIAGNLTSTGGTVTITPGPTSINLEAAGGSGYGAFKYFQPSNTGSAFGVGTSGTYTLGSLVGLTTTPNGNPIGFDRSGTSFSGTTWTCPKTGIWNLSMSVTINNMSGATWTSCSIISPTINVTIGATTTVYGLANISAPGYGGWVVSPLGDQLTVQYSTMVFMNASNTAVFKLYVNPDNTSVASLYVGPVAANPVSTNATYISGYYISA